MGHSPTETVTTVRVYLTLLKFLESSGIKICNVVFGKICSKSYNFKTVSIGNQNTSPVFYCSASILKYEIKDRGIIFDHETANKILGLVSLVAFALPIVNNRWHEIKGRNKKDREMTS